MPHYPRGVGIPLCLHCLGFKAPALRWALVAVSLFQWPPATLCYLLHLHCFYQVPPLGFAGMGANFSDRGVASAPPTLWAAARFLHRRLQTAFVATISVLLPILHPILLSICRPSDVLIRESQICLCQAEAPLLNYNCLTRKFKGRCKEIFSIP